MSYENQFYIGKIPVWIAEVDGVPLWKTNHKRSYLFPKIIQNRDHAQELLDYFSIISIDLREDYRYVIFAGSGIAVDSMFHRVYEHSAIKSSPYPRSLIGGNMFYFLDDAESALSGLQLHFKYMREKLQKVTKEIRGELANITQNVCQNTEEMNRLRIGLLENPRRKTDLNRWMELHAEE